MNGIKKYRVQAELTQQQLADVLHVSRASVAMWETGKALPSAALLPLIARVLGCSIDALYAENAR